MFGDTSSHHLPDELETDGIDSLVSDISQVSLSATTLDLRSSSKTSLLSTLIFAAAYPTGLPSTNLTLRLPPKHVSEKIIARYVRDILPDLPFINEASLYEHLHKADTSPYSTFCLAMILATTSRYLHSSSADRSAGIYRSALQCLERTFQLSKMSNNLQQLESVLFLAQYAAFAGDGEANIWALSGIALRICVDLGLHKSANSSSELRLFWSSYALDRSVAVALDYPFGIADAVIENSVFQYFGNLHTSSLTKIQTPSSMDVFHFRRLQSAVYTADESIEDSLVQKLREDLEDWYHSFQPRSKSPALEIEFVSLICELDRKAGLSPPLRQVRLQENSHNSVPWYLILKEG